MRPGWQAPARAGPHTSRVHPPRRPQALLDKLGLTECRAVKIGAPLEKGISGGQAKRTNIGIALITNPRWGSHGLTKTQCRCCKESVIQIRSTSTAD